MDKSELGKPLYNDDERKLSKFISDNHISIDTVKGALSLMFFTDFLLDDISHTKDVLTICMEKDSRVEISLDINIKKIYDKDGNLITENKEETND